MSDKKCVSIGGQAVIEGVMMRAPNKFVVAVRKPDGNIIIKKEDIKIDSKPLFKKPLIRGLIALYDSVILGVKALNFSADHGLPEEEKSKNKKMSKLENFLGMFLGIGVAIALFLYIPLFLTELLKNVIPLIEKSFLMFNFVDGIIRVVIFVGYIFVISRMKDIARVFAYHGAEHKSIYTYEAGLDLTVENARKMSRFHPRCGTSFLLIVMIVSILVFSLIPKDSHFAIKFGSRIVLLPVIAGLSYEILKLSGKFSDNFIVKILIAPGLWLQRLTTKEPDDKMLEVAITSINEALETKKQVTENIEYAA